MSGAEAAPAVPSWPQGQMRLQKIRILCYMVGWSTTQSCQEDRWRSGWAARTCKTWKGPRTPNTREVTNYIQLEALLAPRGMAWQRSSDQARHLNLLCGCGGHVRNTTLTSCDWTRSPVNFMQPAILRACRTSTSQLLCHLVSGMPWPF